MAARFGYYELCVRSFQLKSNFPHSPPQSRQCHSGLSESTQQPPRKISPLTHAFSASRLGRPYIILACFFDPHFGQAGRGFRGFDFITLHPVDTNTLKTPNSKLQTPNSKLQTLGRDVIRPYLNGASSFSSTSFSDFETLPIPRMPPEASATALARANTSFFKSTI